MEDTLKYYLAASWSRREEMVKIAERLASHGVEICSDWIFGKPAPMVAKEKFLEHWAMQDLEQVRGASAIIRFTDDLTPIRVPSHLATGARFFEMGVAYQMGKPVYVVGGNQCIFDRLPNVTHLKNVNALVRKLSLEEIH